MVIFSLVVLKTRNSNPFFVMKQNTTSATTVQNTVSEAKPTPWEFLVLGVHASPNDSSHKKDL